MRTFRAPTFIRALLLVGCVGSLDACSFSEGPDWQPLANPAETGRQSIENVASASGGAKRASLADLAAGVPLPPPPGGGAASVGRMPPLAVIRFGAAPVDFEPALYDAVSGALQRRPTTAFDLVAVTSYVGDAEEAAFASHLRRVFRALLAMGLPTERVSLSALSLPGVRTDEVHIYAR